MRIFLLLALIPGIAFAQSRPIVPGDVGIQTPFGAIGDVLVAGPDTSKIKDSLTLGTNGGISLSGGGVPAYNNCYWNDTDTCTTTNVRIRERLLIGNAVLANDNRINCCVSTWTLGLNLNDQWQARDGQLVVMSDRGGPSVVGMAKASQGDSLGVGLSPATIGVSSFALQDTALATPPSAWANYAECSYTSAQAGFCFGMEIDTRNASTNATPNPTADPYSIGQGTINLWLAAGAGAGSLNPSNAAIAIVPNGNTFNEGIIIKDGALTKDGSLNSTALAMGQRAQIQWYIAGGQVGATIRSQVSTNGNGMQLLFQNQSISLLSASGNNILTTTHTGSAVNGFQFNDSVTLSAPVLQVTGSDTNIGISLNAKGTGNIAIGTGSNIVSLPVVTTGTPVASLCLDASNNIIKKTTTGACI